MFYPIMSSEYQANFASRLIRRWYKAKRHAPTHLWLSPRYSSNSESFRERVVEAERGGA